MQRRVTFLAICVLQEAIERVDANEPAATLGLRLALAHLYAVGDRRGEHFDREPYDRVWRAAAAGEQLQHGAKAWVGRAQELTAAFNGIARAAGMSADTDMLQIIRRARRG